jgi:hypothetical protein
MKQHGKKILGVSLISLALIVPFAHDANAYYYGGYHGYRGGIYVGAPYYAYGYAPAYYAPPPYAYAPPPYPYAPPSYAYAPVPVVAPAYPLAGIGVGVHIR